ncbi:hypothetical protein B0A55_06366 [Friedmanniomyces simplex]|uniref:Uncharacterized protein n=1 Tax=Friedmanniomyces simplex TaxID=329884 RepID=A0A4V5NFR5_9PEZI|nr:hypothetical protein B0A55_06366 [Friedmanniomyces simplex]
MSVSRRLKVLTGFTPGFVVIAALIAAMVVSPSPKINDDFSRSSHNFIIATQVSIVFLMVNCTAAPLLQVGRKLGAGNAGPFIGYTGTGTNGSGGEGLRSRKHVSIKDAYDLDSVTRGKLSPRNVQSVVAGGNAYSQDGRIPGQHSQGVRSRDDDGVSMESDNSQKFITKRTVEQDVVRG